MRDSPLENLQFIHSIGRMETLIQLFVVALALPQRSTEIQSFRHYHNQAKCLNNTKQNMYYKKNSFLILRVRLLIDKE